jgi:hypothetical protein
MWRRKEYKRNMDGIQVFTKYGSCAKYVLCTKYSAKHYGYSKPSLPVPQFLHLKNLESVHICLTFNIQKLWLRVKWCYQQLIKCLCAHMHIKESKKVSNKAEDRWRERQNEYVCGRGEYLNLLGKLDVQSPKKTILCY